MTKIFEPRLDILPAAQFQLWPQLRAASDLGFVLYGGTAIALRLGHRPSIDFDFFSEQPLDREAIKAAFPFVAQSTSRKDERNTWVLEAPCADTSARPVQVSFFGTLSFGRVGAPDLTADGVLQVADLDDLMAHKVKVVLQRAEAKDYRDVAAMINAGVSLPKGLASARALFGSNFQPSESLKALVYFEDGDLRTLSRSEQNTLIDAVHAVADLPEVSIISNRLCSAIQDDLSSDNDKTDTPAPTHGKGCRR